MKYVGIQTQIWRNNRNTVILLCMFPVILLGLVFAFIVAMDFLGVICCFFSDPQIGSEALQKMCREPAVDGIRWSMDQALFITALPYVLGVTAIWFLIAYVANTSIIRHATHARPLERRENVRVYNIVENLCIAGGIEMPKINIIEDSNLNAFASGIDVNSYTITLTSGIIDKLDDAELSAVVGHELTHIRNRDTRLMIVCIVFVGIFSTLMTMSLKVMGAILRGSSRSRNRKNGGGIAIVFVILLVVLMLSSIAYFFSTMTRLAISRKREYVADAGGAELCGDPLALSNALRKISAEPGLSRVHRDDVAQLYIVHPDEEGDEEENSKLSSLVAKVNLIFCTHPDTPERIRLLEQF